jgi:spermidine synthase
VVNAPVSVITGMLFPTACRWVRQDRELAVSRVYILEAAGSFFGGLATTALLWLGVSSARVFFILAFAVSLSVFSVQLAKILKRRKRAQDYQNNAWRAVGVFTTFALSILILAGVPLCVRFGADESLMGHLRIVKWAKLLGKETFRGSFQTAQAEYLYGMYNDQWVAVREGSAVEALPDEASAGRIAAIALCQKPDAKRILVVGSGLGLCRQLLELSQIEHLDWAHCDIEYVQKVDRFIPSELRIKDKRFDRLDGDVRSLLAGKKNYYDIVIVNLPDATSSVLNRFYTFEFYHQIKDSLGPDGVLAVRVTGGENIMGTELINLGASVKLTLEGVFSQFVLTPGDEMWFIASDSEKLTGNPGVLQDGYATIEGGEQIFPPQALLSVYLPDRAAFALENYSRADLPRRLLVNRDSRPLTHLYSLLLAAKQSGAPVTKFVKHLALVGPSAFIIPILVFVVLRVAYAFGASKQGTPSSFDSAFLVFSAGFVSIGVVIVLMYLYQTRFGMLYLHIGIISSLFMVGLTVGASLIRLLLLGRAKTRSELLLPAIMFVHAIILASIAFWPSEQWTQLSFALAFVVSGLCAGCYFPLAARQLADSGFETGQAGSKLETADHLGASIGGVAASLALVPVLGTKAALLIFALLILANVPAAALRIYRAARGLSFATGGLSLRGLGYVLFGVGLSVVLCSNLLARAGARLSPSLPQDAAQALAGEARLETGSTIVDDRDVEYFKAYDANETLIGYVFSSEDLAREVRGFGGKMNLAVYIDTGGELIDYHIIRSNETPAYLELLSQPDANNVTWYDYLKGRQLFQPDPFDKIDSVTGATVSCDAILAALKTSSHTFATEVLGRTLEAGVEERIGRAKYMPDQAAICLISACVLTLVVIFYGGFWSRLAVLIFNIVAGGIVLNAQYSTEQIATTLSLHAPSVVFSGTFVLIVGVPLLAAIFGNIYCGYICPFGAAQELLGYMLPNRFKPQVPLGRMRKARFVKYAILLVLVVVFFLSRNRTTLAADPLIEVFHLRSSIYDLQVVNYAVLIVVIALIGSVFYSRFWCRYLCPAGAFLSLLNNLALLKRFLPAKRFGRCEFGLTAADHMDCLYCDKCRYEGKAAVAEEYPSRPDFGPMKVMARYLMVGVVASAVLVSTVSVRRFLRIIPADFGQPAVTVSSGGQPRDVDMQRIRTMIEQRRLSDREAEFYKILSETDDQTEAQESE